MVPTWLKKFLNGPASFWDLFSSYLAQSSYLVRNKGLTEFDEHPSHFLQITAVKELKFRHYKQGFCVKRFFYTQFGRSNNFIQCVRQIWTDHAFLSYCINPNWTGGGGGGRLQNVPLPMVYDEYLKNGLTDLHQALWVLRLLYRSSFEINTLWIGDSFLPW